MTQDTATEGRKTTQDHWEGTHSEGQIRLKIPSKLNPATANFMRLMRRYVRPGMHVLEVGFAPGKYLAWLAKVQGAEVAGVDYSRPGIATAHRLFDALSLKGDFRCEDFMTTSFAPGSFDVVYSMGVIEHFDDPRPMVRKHVELLKPNGTAVIAIPHYGGIFGTLQRRFDPENLALHNTQIMNVPALQALAPADLPARVRAFPYGRMYSLVSWRRKLPSPVASLCELGITGFGLLQPIQIDAISPWLVLEITRQSR